MDRFAFESLDFIERQFCFQGVSYIVQEATDGAAGRYQSDMARSAKMSDGKVSFEGRIDEIRRDLLSNCLFRIDISDKGTTRTSLKSIDLKTWPSKVTRELVQWVIKTSELDNLDTLESINKEINRLTRKKEKLIESGSEDVAGNSLAGNPPGS